MKTHKFSLGLRFDIMADEEGQITPGQLWEEIFSVLTIDDAKGLQLYGGMEETGGSSSEPCYLCMFTNGSLRQMRNIYRKLEGDAGINMYIAATRPYLQTNALERAEGLTYFGRVQGDGCLLGGDEPFFDVHLCKRHGKRRPVGKGIVFLLAPGAFFNTLTSRQAIRRLTLSARKQFPGVRVHPMPITDGGPGTVDAILAAANGTGRLVQIQGPQGAKRDARYAVLRGNTALIEMPDCFSPAGAQGEGLCSSFGIGELIRRALDEGLEKIIIGLPDSCINDGGLGCLRALGVKLLDAEGAELVSQTDTKGLAKIDTELLHPRVRNTRFVLMTDCETPLDAASLYGPLRENYRGILQEAAAFDPALREGAGAAGGLGAALMAILGAERKPAVDALLDAAEFDRRLRSVSLVVTGEGRIDRTSLRSGSAVGEILKRASRQRVPVAVIAGHIGDGGEALLERRDCSIMIVADAFDTSEMEVLVERFDSAAERMFRFIRLGREIERVSARKSKMK